MSATDPERDHDKMEDEKMEDEKMEEHTWWKEAVVYQIYPRSFKAVSYTHLTLPTIA